MSITLKIFFKDVLYAFFWYKYFLLLIFLIEVVVYVCVGSIAIMENLRFRESACDFGRHFWDLKGLE